MVVVTISVATVSIAINWAIIHIVDVTVEIVTPTILVC